MCIFSSDTGSLYILQECLLDLKKWTVRLIICKMFNKIIVLWYIFFENVMTLGTLVVDEVWCPSVWILYVPVVCLSMTGMKKIAIILLKKIQYKDIQRTTLFLVEVFKKSKKYLT